MKASHPKAARSMRWASRVAVGAFLVLGASQAKAAPDNFTEMERGRSIATLGDCVACHTAEGGQPFAGGMQLKTPFGPIAVPNITPDNETGIGRWSKQEFITAMQTGMAPGGEHLYPAFPYVYYTKVSKRDLGDLYDYLRTLPPVKNDVDRDTLPFPFNIRAMMIGWNMMFFKPGEFKPEEGRSAAYNRGAYLVEGLAHCAMCHTPKNMLGADNTGKELQGTVLQNWLAPNITRDTRIGVGGWSVAEIVEYLKTGRNAHSTASGPMAEEIVNSSSKMSDGDLTAIATYLKERGPEPADTKPTPVAASDQRMRAGQAVFTDNCSACHTATGVGVDYMFPRLAGSAIVQQDDPTTLVRVLTEGAKAAATNAAPTGPAMPAFGWRLNDTQMADVLTYIRNSWGNAAAPITADQVSRVRKDLAAQ